MSEEAQPQALAALEQAIIDDLKKAMRDGDGLRKKTLRSIRAAIQRAQLDLVAKAKLAKGEPLDAAQVEAVIQKQAKQRRDALEQFEAGGRPDLAEVESAELEIIENYLPKQLDDAAIEAAVQEAIAESGATGPSDMGKVMAVLMPKLSGRADGKRVSAAVRAALIG